MGADVFISYAKAGTQQEARALRDALQAAGIGVFLDEEGIPPGSGFPTRIADGLLAARLMVIFADASYFSRPWCVYEFRVGTAPYRAAVRAATDGRGALRHLVVALPASGGTDGITPHLPPPLAEGSWPRADQTATLAALIAERLASIDQPLSALLEGVDDDAVRSLRMGALVPAAAKPHPGPTYLARMPGSLKERFVGRTEVLWSIFDSLESRGADAATSACVIEGGAGMGKTQVAAEYVARYGPRHYRGGVVWIDASGDDEDLTSQLRGALQAFAPGSHQVREPGSAPAEQRAALSAALVAATRERAGSGPILWVVDNVPAPTQGKRPEPLAKWCPVREHVSLLCTSRQRGIKDADVTLPLGELAVEAAIELLTQPPAKPSWLGDDAWRRVVRWIGCWPLGLRVLNTSLADGFLSANRLLAKTEGAEPAAALDAEVEALRDEIPDDYVRSVAEVLHVSYTALAERPEALRAAHLIARLARVPLAQELAEELAPGPAFGVLAKRSWVQAVEGSVGGGRRWDMHRVTASYLRGVSPGPEQEFVALAEWLLRVFRAGHPWSVLRAMVRHVRVVTLSFAEWLAKHPESTAARTARDLAMALATWELSNEDARGLRFIVAEFADAIGADAALVSCFEELYAAAEPEAARNLVSALSGLRTSAAAATLLASATVDPRDRVRWQAFVQASHSTRADILAIPLLDAFMREENANVLANAMLWYEPFLASPESVLRAIISQAAHHLNEVDAKHRRVLVELLGRILRQHGDGLESGGWRSTHLRGALLHQALTDPAPMVAAEAAGALARSEHPDTFTKLAGAVARTDDIAAWRRATDVLVAYADALSRPAAHEFKRVEEDGQLHLEGRFGAAGKLRPEILTPLVDVSMESTDDSIRQYAIAALNRQDAGKLALADRANELVAARAYDRVLKLAETAIQVSPDFSSAYWWRAQAYDGLERNAEAIADYTRVVELTPGFAEAFYRRGILLSLAGNRAGALGDFTAAIAAEPQHLKARYYRAIVLSELQRDTEALDELDAAIACSSGEARLHHMRAGVLLKLERIPEAIDAATRAIALDGSVAESWLIRGVAHDRAGDPGNALADLERATALAPADGRAAEYRAHLLAKLV
jgi:tetratricopeptide (TPR) repeat protein